MARRQPPQQRQYYSAGPQEGGIVNQGGQGPSGPPNQGGAGTRSQGATGPGTGGGGWPGVDYSPNTTPPPPPPPPPSAGNPAYGPPPPPNPPPPNPDNTDAWRRLWGQGVPVPEIKGPGFGPFDWTKLNPPIQGGPDGLFPMGGGAGWDWDTDLGQFEFGGGVQGNAFDRPGYPGGGGMEGWMKRKGFHPTVGGSWKHPMPWDLPGTGKLSGGLVIDPDNNFGDSTGGISYEWDLMGDMAGGSAGYQ